MSGLIRLAWRNLFRNFRRTLLNISMIVCGFTAIVVFVGFSENILKGLRLAVIYIQYGHVQVGTANSWDLKVVDHPNDKLIADPQVVIDKTKDLSNFSTVTGRLEFYAMLSTSENSVSARALSYNPSLEMGIKRELEIVSGTGLTSDNESKIVLGEGLVRSLLVKPGESMTVLAQTVDGAMNAVDVEVAGVARTNVAEIDNTTFYIPLKVAQKLLDTDRVERLVYFLPSDRIGVEREIEKLRAVLPPDLVPKAWTDLATLYRQTVEYFDAQNIIINMIILSLVLFSISNTVSNSVVERTGEIGTLRAIGDRRLTIVMQFMTEALILSLLSGAISIVVALSVTHLITAVELILPIPGTTTPMTIAIEVIPRAYIFSFLLTSATTLAATLLPAWRASKMPIVEALKRNI